jgi:hypothetical protein
LIHCSLPPRDLLIDNESNGFGIDNAFPAASRARISIGCGDDCEHRRGGQACTATARSRSNGSDGEQAGIRR